MATITHTVDSAKNLVEALGIKTLKDLVAHIYNAGEEETRVVVSDAEYINQALAGPRPTPEHWKEVVQIGAVEVINGKIGATFNIRVYPRVKFGDLSEEQWKDFTRITRVEKETVSTYTTTFEEAWKEYLDFINGDIVVVIAGDREVYKWNWKLVGQDKDAEINAMNWIILKPLLPAEFKTKLSGELHGCVDAPFDANNDEIHDAVFDSHSMAHFLIHYQVTA